MPLADSVCSPLEDPKRYRVVTAIGRHSNYWTHVRDQHEPHGAVIEARYNEFIAKRVCSTPLPKEAKFYPANFRPQVTVVPTPAESRSVPATQESIAKFAGSLKPAPKPVKKPRNRITLPVGAKLGVVKTVPDGVL